MKRALLLLAVPVWVFAAIDPNGVVLHVTQEQKQISQLHSRTSDGRRDRSTRRVRILNVDCRVLGHGPAESALFRWFFIGRSPVDGKFDYYSVGSKSVEIPKGKTIELTIVSDPLKQDEYVEMEFATSVYVTAGSTPHGWVLMLIQNGYVVSQAASEAGLIAWMSRNPPPRPKNRD